MTQLRVAWAVLMAAHFGPIVGCDLADDGVVDDDENIAPIARIVAPQLAAVGVAARFDASGSDDEDGELVAFDLAFSDGTVVIDDDDGVFDHVFAEAGRVSVIVGVTDDDDERVEGEVSLVVVEGAIEACDCDAPCLDDASDGGGVGLCVDGACVVVGSSDGEDVDVDELNCGGE